MTANDFRRLALSFPEPSERAHMGHPDFRVGGKIFATLGYPDDDWAMVKLTPFEQEMFVKSHPASLTRAQAFGDAAAPRAFASGQRGSPPCAARSSPHGASPPRSVSSSNSTQTRSSVEHLDRRAAPSKMQLDAHSVPYTTPPLTPPAPCPNFFHAVSGSRKLPPTPKLFRFGGTSCH